MCVKNFNTHFADFTHALVDKHVLRLCYQINFLIRRVCVVQNQNHTRNSLTTIVTFDFFNTKVAIDLICVYTNPNQVCGCSVETLNKFRKHWNQRVD